MQLAQSINLQLQLQLATGTGQSQISLNIGEKVMIIQLPNSKSMFKQLNNTQSFGNANSAEDKYPHCRFSTHSRASVILY